jgi:hypothetical protein
VQQLQEDMRSGARRQGGGESPAFFYPTSQYFPNEAKQL